jgi:hypothetical protein
MHIRCSYCRHSFNLSRDYIAQAVAEANENKKKYASVECIKCRKQIKVPVSQMKRYVPQIEQDAKEDENIEEEDKK